MFWCTEHEKRNMNKMLVAMFLPLLLLLASITPVTSRLNSVQVVSYRGWRKTKNGEVRCAMDTANETISLSSQQQCSLRCAKDATCTGFNMKNELTCDLYNYKPKLSYLVSAYKFYQVDTHYFKFTVCNYWRISLRCTSVSTTGKWYLVVAAKMTKNKFWLNAVLDNWKMKEQANVKHL